MWNQALPKLFILSAGVLLILLQYAAGDFSDQLQLNIFLAGLIFFGIPHGAADRLVASQNLGYQQKQTASLSFNFIYLGSIALFSILLFSFPLIGTSIFILLSAYHFGESDLQKLNAKTFFGKIILFNYGLCVLGVIFLPKFPQLLVSISGTVTNANALAILNLVNEHHSFILIVILVVFVFNCVLYFIKDQQAFKYCRYDLLLNILLLPALYVLPMLLSFSFYFLLWHSIFSMKTIVQYLLHNKDLSRRSIIKEILSNSAIALLGIGVFCIIASVGARQYNLVIYAVFGLAVLTASHMQVMHQMYNQIRLKRGNL